MLSFIFIKIKFIFKYLGLIYYYELYSLIVKYFIKIIDLSLFYIFK